jgi:hypothetical protein
MALVGYLTLCSWDHPERMFVATRSSPKSKLKTVHQVLVVFIIVLLKILAPAT